MPAGSQTFTIAAAVDMQYYLWYGSTWPPNTPSARSLGFLAVDKDYVSPFSSPYQVYVGLLRWNTSGLPDNASITSATLRLYPTATGNSNSRNLTGDYYAWTGASTSDFTTLDPASPVLTYNLNNVNVSVYNEIPLSNFSGINKTGTTYIRLLISGGAPPAASYPNSNENYISAGDWTNQSTHLPQLVVNYNVNTPPTANFTVGGGTQGQSRSRTFTNTSTDPDGAVVSNVWNFGDGATSTTTSPTHTFAGDGPYSVSLIVADDQGITNTKTTSVTINNPPVPNFTISGAGNSRTFTNTSTDSDGTIASSSWNFGDGGTSTQTSPTHIYTSGGTYTVTLTVTDNLGTSRTTSKSVTITPNVSPTANYSFTATQLTATFIDASTDPDGSIVSRLWTFGDGGNSTFVNPVHVYGGAGTYEVTLKVTDDWGATDTEIKSVTVTDPPPVPAGVAKGYLKKHIFKRAGTLTAGINATQDSVPLNDLSYWPPTGVTLVDNEKMAYTAKSHPNGPGDLLGVSRGLYGTTAATHSASAVVGLLGRHDGGISVKYKIPVLPSNGKITLQELRRHEDEDYFALVELDNAREQVKLDVVGPPTTSGNVSTTFDENGVAVTRTTAITTTKEVRSLTINNPQTTGGDIVITLNGLSKTLTLAGGIAAKWQVEILRGTEFNSSLGTLEIKYHDASGVLQTINPGVRAGLTAQQIANAIRNLTFSGWTTSGSGRVVLFTRSSLSSGQAYISKYGRQSSGSSPQSGSSYYRNTQLAEGVATLSAIGVADLLRSMNFPGWQTGGTLGTSTVTFTALTPGPRTGTYSYSAGSTGATSTSGITQTTAGLVPTTVGAAASIRSTYAGNTYWTVAGTGATVLWTATSSGAKQDATFSAGSTGLQAQMQIVSQGSTDLVAWTKDSLGNARKRRVMANIANTTIFNIECAVSGAGTEHGVVSIWGSLGTDPKKRWWRSENLDLSQYFLGQIVYGVTQESSDALTWEVHTDEVVITDRGETYYHDHNARGNLINQGYGFFLLSHTQPRSDQYVQEFRQPVIPGEEITVGAWLRWLGVPTETPAKPLFVIARHADGTITEMGNMDVSGFSSAGVSGTSAGWVYVYGTFTVPDGSGANRVPAYEFRIASRDITRGTFFFQELAYSLGTSAERTYLYALNGVTRATFTVATPQEVPNIAVGRKRTALESLHEAPAGLSATTRFRSAIDVSSLEPTWHNEAIDALDLPVVQVEDELDGDGLSTPVVAVGYPRAEHRLLAASHTLPTLLTKDRTELPGGVFFHSMEDWYPNTGVDVRVLPSGRVRRQKIYEPVGYFPSLALLATRPDAIRYLQEKWGTEEFIAEIDAQALTLKLLDKPEFARAAPPTGDSTNKLGYWISKEVPAEVVEVKAITE